MKKKSYHPTEVAKILGVSRRKVYYLASRGILQASKDSTSIRITQESINSIQQSLSIEQAQDLMPFSRSKIYEHLRDGEFEPYKINGKALKPMRIVEKSYYDFMERCRIPKEAWTQKKNSHNIRSKIDNRGGRKRNILGQFVKRTVKDR